MHSKIKTTHVIVPHTDVRTKWNKGLIIKLLMNLDLNFDGTETLTTVLLPAMSPQRSAQSRTNDYYSGKWFFFCISITQFTILRFGKERIIYDCGCCTLLLLLILLLQWLLLLIIIITLLF